MNAGPLPDLTALGVPLLAVVGSNDSELARRFVSRVPALVPSASTGVVDGVGHQWNAEQPSVFSNLVRAWLAGESFPPGVRAGERGR